MKRLLLICVLAACSKSNDVSTLREEAVQTAAYYQPRLDAADKRVQAIFKRGTTIPANLPGIEEVGKRLTEARDTILQLRGIIAKGPDGKSAVEKQADLAAKDRKVEDLEKLIDDTETTLERGLTVVNADLDSVESWIALYDQGINKQEPTAAAPPPAQPGAEAATPSPANPVPPTQNQTGQPPAAVQTKPAQPPAAQPKAPAAPAQTPPAKK
jgi:hypothetical protein